MSFAAAIAVSVGAEVIYYGAHADDAAGRAYPDCTPEFETAMNTAIYEGSGRTCHLEAPLLSLNKAGVVKEGLRLGAPYELTWSCYEAAINRAVSAEPVVIGRPPLPPTALRIRH